jgi:hypothetical protein
MLKSSASLLDSDPRYRDQVVLDALTGKYRPMCLQDLRDMVAPIELNAGVPSTIREQFDVATRCCSPYFSLVWKPTML